MSSLPWRLATLCALMSATTAFADTPTITLRGLEGGTTVSGKLLAFDGETYKVATALGEMSLDAAQVSCEGIDCPSSPKAAEPQTLSLAIGSGLAPGLVPLLIEGYAATNGSTMVRTLDDSGNLALRLTGAGPETRITTVPQNPGFAFSAMVDGAANMVLTLEKPEGDAIALARANKTAQLDNQAHQQIVALDAITVVVASTNPVRALSPQQISDVFAGRIANWSALGGPNAPIKPVFANSVLSLPQNPAAPLLENGRVSAAAHMVENAADVSDQVTSDPFAIGLTTFSNMRGATPVSLQTQCGLIIPPNRAAILTGAYPYTQRIVAYSGVHQTTQAHQNLTRYFASDAAQDSVSDAGFVGQRIASISLDGQGQRFVAAMLNAASPDSSEELRTFLTQISQADRLSTTFRFRPGGNILDQKAATDIVRLARYINSRDLSNREILFVGFTDSAGSPQKNRALSAKRAQTVMSNVMSHLSAQKQETIAASSLGYGEIAPIACNDTAIGQQANRRVEIWLRPRALASQ